jgi:single-stranded-DNA-specific exonuclease
MTWIFKNEEGQLKNAALLLSKELGIGHLAATVCVNRGLANADQVNAFLNPKLDQLTHPFKILDLEKAVDHLLALQTNTRKKIRVFTDYDVDGTTGAALLTWFFRDMGFHFDVVQPDRFKDGYGLNPGAVEDAARDGVDTLITVDCGITNFEAAAQAKELGVQLIVVDHHLVDPAKGIPQAFAVIDPQRSDCASGLKQLCGCGLAFYLSMGIRLKAREQNYFVARNIPEPNLKNLLDLVVLATAADMVPLTGDNRILVKHGLGVLRETQKPGLRSMMANAGIEVKTVSPMNLGFALGPRINASGRMGSAETAYRCLTTKDVAEAQKLADQLEAINKERADLQNLIWDEVRGEVTRGLENGKFSHAVVVASENWHEGVVGIVASKVTEHFKKPAVILAIREDGLVKGSVRSYGGYNVLEALHLSQHLLKGYGGHKFAAGLSLARENIEIFVQHYNEMMITLAPVNKRDDLQIEALCTFADFTPQALDELEKLAPFGPGNPEPLFALHANVATQNVLKGRHLKLKLGVSGFKQTIDGIWFNAAERLESTELMEKCAHSKITCAFAGIPELNRFLGRVTPTLRIKAAAEIQ